MAGLFDVQVPTVNEHLKNIFRSGELDEGSVIRKFLTTASDGKDYETCYYNLDAIISVGYRVNSRPVMFCLGMPSGSYTSLTSMASSPSASAPRLSFSLHLPICVRCLGQSWA